MKTVLRFAFAYVAVALMVSCEQQEEIAPSSRTQSGSVIVPAKHTSLPSDISIAPSTPVVASTALDLELTTWTDPSCIGGDRIEFDVYDRNPEFTNPKNYRIALRQGRRLIASQSFSQYCTMNNTVQFRNIPAGEYTYILSSGCTEEAYKGTVNYQGGYWGSSLYIDQSLCD